MKLFRPLLLAGLLLAPAAWQVFATQPAEKKTEDDGPVSYYKDIRPIFAQHCQGCHQPAKPGGGFVMTTYADLLKNGEQMQPGLVPSQIAKSFIIDQVSTNKEGKTAMPK